jgi:hypothetical protein
LREASATLGKAIHIGSDVILGAVTPHVVGSEGVDYDYENAGAVLGLSAGTQKDNKGEQGRRGNTPEKPRAES